MNAAVTGTPSEGTETEKETDVGEEASATPGAQLREQSAPTYSCVPAGHIRETAVGHALAPEADAEEDGSEVTQL